MYYNEKIKFTMPNVKFHANEGTYLHKKGKACRMHMHPEMEYLYITKGAMRCCTEDKFYDAQEGEVIFINGRIPHYTEFLCDNTMYTLVQFAKPMLISGTVKYLVRYLTKTETSCFVFKKDDEHTNFLIEKLMHLIEESKHTLNAEDYFLLSIIYEITGFLHRYGYLSDENVLPDSKSISSILPVIDYVNENYMEQINLDDISTNLNFNKNYLCRLFKKATGGTIVDYLNFVRICKAETLLKSGVSVSQTAESTGFSSQSYFNKVFKKFNSYAPNEYKKLSSYTQFHNA